jgi:hypothetical protein
MAEDLQILNMLFKWFTSKRFESTYFHKVDMDYPRIDTSNILDVHKYRWVVFSLHCRISRHNQDKLWISVKFPWSV